MARVKIAQAKLTKIYKAAELIRKNLIKNLEECKTAGGFKAIMAQYRKDTLDGHFSLVGKNLTKSRRETLERLDAQIDMLINEKREQFEDKLTQLHEKEKAQQAAELSSSSDESEHSDVSEHSEHPEVIEPPKETEHPEVIEPPKETEQLEETEQLGEIIDAPPHDLNHIPACCSVGSEKKVEKVLKKEKSKTVLTPDSTISTSEIPVVTREINPERVVHLARVKAQLDALSDKKAEFIGKYSAHAERYPNDLAKLEEFNKAIQATENIHHNVTSIYNAYVYGDIELDHFKEAAAPLLDNDVEDVQTLKSHRGLKEIVVNLLAAILTVGLIHTAAAIAKGKFEFRLFKPATKSGVIVDNLEDAIEHSQVAAATA
ncbi:hypothetical protein [Legionella maioricensis]|uniref:Uncharacterized protein n=1 Tax=Legionella maioricensis TaxID=2896528 RepID=A0A9X2CXY6_9GAMM|nr:hypothetical protein [Legionella maioricensis]MCL9682796.1 hypothetical protein [Legionella maioricensis]MCL9686576.1 hypothetical protein [Legionella maioricensis]